MRCCYPLKIVKCNMIFSAFLSYAVIIPVQYGFLERADIPTMVHHLYALRFQGDIDLSPSSVVRQI